MPVEDESNNTDNTEELPDIPPKPELIPVITFSNEDDDSSGGKQAPEEGKMLADNDEIASSLQQISAPDSNDKNNEEELRELTNKLSKRLSKDQLMDVKSQSIHSMNPKLSSMTEVTYTRKSFKEEVLADVQDEGAGLDTSVDVSQELGMLQEKLSSLNETTGNDVNEICENADSSSSMQKKFDKLERLKLIESIRETYRQQSLLKDYNDFLDTKTAEWFVKKEKTSSLENEDYQTICEYYRKLNDKVLRPLTVQFNEETSVLMGYKKGEERMKLQKHLEDVDQMYKNFCVYRLEKAGRKQSLRQYFLCMLKEEVKQEDKVRELRRKALKLRVAIKKEETRGQTYLTIGSGLRMVDFECMKVTFNTYQTSLQSIKNEIKAYREKCELLLNILCHIREKLYFDGNSTARKRCQLKRLENDLERKRTSLQDVKIERKTENKITTQLRRNAGMLEFPLLIDHYETLKERNRRMETQIAKMKAEQKRLSHNKDQYKYAFNQIKGRYADKASNRQGKSKKNRNQMALQTVYETDRVAFYETSKTK